MRPGQLPPLSEVCQDTVNFISLETAKLVIKLKHDMIPIPLRNYFDIRDNSAHGYNLRHQRDTSQSMIYRTRYAEKSLQYKIPFVWNDVPENLQGCETFTVFKKHFKIHLLQLQDEDPYRLESFFLFSS